MTNIYSLDRVEETAQRMYKRYSTPAKAVEMAGYHACDYPPDSEQYKYWRAVSHRIEEIHFFEKAKRHASNYGLNKCKKNKQNAPQNNETPSSASKI